MHPGADRDAPRRHRGGGRGDAAAPRRSGARIARVHLRGAQRGAGAGRRAGRRPEAGGGRTGPAVGPHLEGLARSPPSCVADRGACRTGDRGRLGGARRRGRSGRHAKPAGRGRALPGDARR